MERLIERFDMEMVSPDCTPGSTWWSARILVENDISPVMPYLNAELDQTNYNHKAKTLLWDNKDEGIRCAFRPREIAIAPVADRETAKEICDRVVKLLCDIWSRHAEIEPDFEGKAPPPSIIQIIKLLPGTNCKDCGCATCMAFAAGLIKKEAELGQCKVLLKEEYSNNRITLLELLS